MVECQIRRRELRGQSHLAFEVFDAALELPAAERRLAVRGDPGQEPVYPPEAKLDALEPKQEKVAALAELYRRAGLNPPAFPDAMRELRFTEKAQCC